MCGGVCPPTPPPPPLPPKNIEIPHKTPIDNNHHRITTNTLMRPEPSAIFPNLFRPDFGLRFQHHSIQLVKFTKEQKPTFKIFDNCVFGNTLKMAILSCTTSTLHY